MKLLILDFLRRWWWLFTVALLLSIGSSLGGFPFVFAPAAAVALMLDAQRGVFRAVRPLPVSRNVEAKAWWFVGVPLLPLLSIPALAIGVLLFQAMHPFEPNHFVAPPVAAPLEAVSGMPLPRPPALPSFAQPQRFIGPFSISNKPPAPWFSAGVQTWVALGYAGLCFFLMQ